MRALVATLGVSAALLGCRHDYVKVDDAALGRVVVYRNGVAYYERRAVLDKDTLRIRVPRDKVNDFLKSLTVRDAKTGKPMPVGFPSPGAESGGMVDMVIELPKGAPSDLVLTYITESPAWKPSYRLMVEDDQVRLQGWAIVDNTSGEDWQDVRVGVGASSALSFRYDLWSVRTVLRETLSSNDQFAVAPPTGNSPFHDGSVAGTTYALSDDELPKPSSHPDVQQYNWAEEEVVGELSAPQAVTLSGGSGGGRAADSAATRKELAKRQAEVEKRRQEAKMREEQAKRKVKALAESINKSGNTWVIEGYAAPTEPDRDARSLDRANVLRNQLIEEGVAPAQLQVRAGKDDSQNAGVRLVERADSAAAEGAPVAAAENDRPVGESHFENPTPMTVAANRSVMVSIVDQATPGRVVYMYDDESSRGNERFAFKAIRFDNPTQSALEAGPVTVYDKGGFVGEGLTEPIPAESAALVPFALDRQVVVDKSQKASDRIKRLVSLQRGVLTTEVAYTRKTSYQLTNRLRKPVTVYVRHTVAKGWELEKAGHEVERLGDAHLFKVALEPRGTGSLTIEEATPMSRTLDLRSPEALDLVAVYLQGASEDKELTESMKELLALNTEMADLQQSIATLRQRLADYRVRMDELHVQIVSLKAVKSGGNLMKHLKKKMEEISELVQRTTMDLVDGEEKLMLARIRFQDAVAEMTLSKRKTAQKD